jgi:hypothetical protein
MRNLDALLRNLPGGQGNPGGGLYGAGAHANASMTFGPVPHAVATPPRSNSEAGTPVSSSAPLGMHPPMSPGGGTSRQNALLSLLLPQDADQSSAGGYSSQVTPQQARPGDVQGKALLEQIMAKCVFLFCIGFLRLLMLRFSRLQSSPAAVPVLATPNPRGA